MFSKAHGRNIVQNSYNFNTSMRKYAKHIGEVIYFVENTAVFQMAHFYWHMMSALTNVISRKLDELHRLTRHAIRKNVFNYLFWDSYISITQICHICFPCW